LFFINDGSFCNLSIISLLHTLPTPWCQAVCDVPAAATKRCKQAGQQQKYNSNKVNNMKLLSLEPFVPSGTDFEKAKQFFGELGFRVSWDGGDYVGFEKDGGRFILQKYDNRSFAENFMLSVRISDVKSFREEVLARKLPEKFGIRIGPVTQQPYGKEVNLIDPAGVCWHFVE
jgi:hypothetical protein